MACFARLRRAALVALGLGVPGWGAGCHLFGGLTDLEFSDEGAGGQGGGTPADCVPSSSDGPVDSGCGVFVSSSGDDLGGDGSQDNPYETIERAISDERGAIYLCAEPFGEAVTLPSGRDLFGALDCKDSWAYVPTKPSVIEGPAGAVALTINGAGASRIADLRVTAAVEMNQTGASSIAVLVDGATVRFERCALEAGRGGSGVKDTVPSEPLPQALVGAGGLPGCSGMAGIKNVGPLGEVLTCGDGTTSVGGGGGDGNPQPGAGFRGGDGASVPETSPVNPNGGAGETSVVCGVGEVGAPGAEGAHGAGATGVGTIDAAGYHGPAGAEGAGFGLPGQGGGGGGGEMVCINIPNVAGATGAAGGTGGCGGAPGGGGGAGGSSIALLSISASIELQACSLSAADGGRGAQGTVGQNGGAGASGGDPLANSDACVGGRGGMGGRGGGGGGGLGGHSIAVAFVGDAPQLTDTTTVMADAGVGGDGADETNVSARGGDGFAEEIRSFD